MSIGLKKIIKLFEDGNVCVTGLRGRGKDILMANVVERRQLPYIANIDYTEDYIPLNFKDIDCGKNNYRNFISGDLNFYDFPYEDGTDIYISDVGVYFPSQNCSELNREYKEVPIFMALSRQLGECNVHFNVQNLNRAWDKLREQSDLYIACQRCLYIPLSKIFSNARDLVLQRVIVYDRYQSCVDRISPYQPKVPLMASREMRQLDDIERQRYRQTFGMVSPRILIYTNRSSYNTREFKEKLAGGKRND